MASDSEGNPLLQERGHALTAQRCGCVPRIHGNMILVAVCAAVSGFCFGYDIGIIDQVLAMGSFRLWSGTRPGIDADAAGTTGWIVSTFLFGCIGGSLAVSYLADAIGRKRSSELVGFRGCGAGSESTAPYPLLQFFSELCSFVRAASGRRAPHPSVGSMRCESSRALP